MLDVYFTIDVEVWCDGWHDLDARFPAAFERYVYGQGRRGGLPLHLQILNDHGIHSTCFVEPLFAGRFGIEPLTEIVGLILAAGHEVQLHLHPEWVDECQEPLLPGPRAKRQHLRQYSASEQTELIRVGARWLEAAGAPPPTAFRAGSFAFNTDTLTALERNGIHLDSSYNASLFGATSGVSPDRQLLACERIGGVVEMPMTVFHDGLGLRHAQLTACSASELESLLLRAAEQSQGYFMLLSHNFELMTPDQRKVDAVVVRRLERVAALLLRHPDLFRIRGMHGSASVPSQKESRLLRSPLWRTGLRVAEQAWRRVAA
jgi:peptidoglycan/xylan/chitin deacetylase (PgdA/CDA1 family)